LKLPVSELLSESRMSEKRFLDLSEPDKKEYLEKYPFSKHKRLMKKGKKSEELEHDEPEDELDGSDEEDQDVEESSDEEEDQDVEESSDEEGDADFDDISDVTDVSVEVKKNFPIVRRSITEGYDSAVENRDRIADNIREKVSARAKTSIKDGFEKVYSGGSLPPAAKDAMTKVATSVFKIAIGAAALTAIGAAAGPIGLLVAMNYVNSLENFEDKFAERKRKKAEDRKAAAEAELEAIRAERKAKEEKLKSNSNDFNDPTRMLVDDFLRWYGKVDKVLLSEKITELSALKNKPLESNSSIGVRLTFPLCPTQKHLPNDKRSKYLIRARGRDIGYITADPNVKGRGKASRCWLVTLEDGFVESNYHTGKSTNEPFTAVRSNTVILKNPYRFNILEAKSWVKSTIKRELL
jgi:hypothetical protein